VLGALVLLLYSISQMVKKRNVVVSQQQQNQDLIVPNETSSANYILSVIKVDPDDTLFRETIRSTWAKPRQVYIDEIAFDLSHTFIIGDDHHHGGNRPLSRENTFYKDIFLSPTSTPHQSGTAASTGMMDFSLRALFCWLIQLKHQPHFVIVADKHLYLRVEKFATVMSLLAPDGFIGSVDERLVGLKGSSLTSLCHSTGSLAAAGFQRMMVSGLISTATADLMSCCPAETTYSIFPLNPDQMRRTDQHYAILHDYYDAY